MKKLAFSSLVTSLYLFCLSSGFVAAQAEGYREPHEMSPLERSYKQKYENLSAMVKDLRKQIDDLQGLKNSIDYVIDVVQWQPTDDAGLSAQKYNQLQSLLPVGIVFSRDLQRKETQMAQVLATREALKEELLRWRGSLPFWWTE